MTPREMELRARLARLNADSLRFYWVFLVSVRVNGGAWGLLLAACVTVDARLIAPLVFVAVLSVGLTWVARSRMARTRAALELTHAAINQCLSERFTEETDADIDAELAQMDARFLNQPGPRLKK